MRIEEIYLNKIFPDESQPRKTFDKKELEELSSSILKRGLLEPLKVIKLNEGYMLIDGERRFRALNILVKHGDKESEKINCIVIDKLKERTLTQLTYDIQKAKIPHLEEGEAYKKLIEEENYSVEDLAMALGKKRAYILSKLKLTAFNENTKQLLSDKVIPANMLYAIDINKSKEAEDRIVDRIRKGKNSYGEARKIILEETKDKKELLNLFLKDCERFKIKCLRFDNKYKSLLKEPDLDFFKHQEVGNILDELIKLEDNLQILDKVNKKVKSIKREMKELERNFGSNKEFTSALHSNQKKEVKE